MKSNTVSKSICNTSSQCKNKDNLITANMVLYYKFVFRVAKSTTFTEPCTCMTSSTLVSESLLQLTSYILSHIFEPKYGKKTKSQSPNKADQLN